MNKTFSPITVKNNSWPLKILNLVTLLVTIFLWSWFFRDFLHAPADIRQSLRFHYPGMVSWPLMTIVSFIVFIKGGSDKGNLLYGLFLALVSQNFVMQYLNQLTGDAGPIPDWVGVLSTAVTGAVYLRSLQFFPKQLTMQDCLLAFRRSKPLAILLGWITRFPVWIMLPAMIVVSYLLFPSDLTYSLIEMVILVIATLLLYANYRNSTPSEKNKILWILWGTLIYTIMTVISIIVLQNVPEDTGVIALVFRSIKLVAVVVSTAMSLFFFDTFNTGILIRRTIVDGLIFIVILLVYNTIEHYFLHWLSHTLHVSNTLLSSLLSGIFVLVFSPVHHRLMQYLGKRTRRRNISQH